MSFRLLGIKILPGCSTSIRKVLREGETYLLTDEYAAGNDELTLEKTLYIKESKTVSTLYDVKGANNHIVHVEVSAIVGKNGDGKSTIVEVILRVINNFAFSFGYTHDQGSLKKVNGLNAILYYEVDSSVYAIKNLNGATEWYCDGTPIILNADTAYSQKKELKAEHADKLFYSLIINYSLYAYNSVILQNENEGKGCWINELFHKNDSYQTPIVLNPMRDEGNIDVNKEEYLSKQRLISLFTTVDKNLTGNEKKESRRVSDTETAIGYAFKLEEESKLVLKSVNEYFDSTRNLYYEWSEVKSSLEKNKALDEDLIGNVYGFLITFLVGKRKARIPIELLKIAKLANTRRNSRESTDLSSLISGILGSYTKNNKLKDKYEFELFSNFRFWNRPKLSYAQLYRLMLITEVWRELTKDNRFYMEGANLDKVLLHRHDDPKSAAMLYVLYKVISIRQKYPSIANNIPLVDEKFTIIQNPWPNENLQGAIENDVDAIYKTHDYRTLKLFQTLHYLECENDDWYGATTDIPQGVVGYTHFIDFDNLKKTMKSEKPKVAMEYLPSPIFDGDIILTSGKDSYALHTLSSGMTQRLNSVGSFVYHLRNLDDVQRSANLINYNNVVAVFEEVELYFHPEYQKSYLNFLLKQIERTYLQRIDNLHVIFVTHSPFILSDVLKENILCLQDGQMDQKVGFDTFGANIHNLLRLPFFLRKGTIGDFAQKTINQIVAALKIYEWYSQNNEVRVLKRNEISSYTSEIGIESKDFDFEAFKEKFSAQHIYDLINILDEPLVRHSLMEIWNGCFSNKSEREQRIEYLEAELERLKNGQNIKN